MLYINPAYEKVWGASCASLYAEPWSFMAPVPSPDRERLADYIRMTQQGHVDDSVEFRVVRPDGTVRYILAHAAPVRNPAGEVYRLAGVALDITDRRNAQDALRGVEQRLRTLFETVNLVVLGLGADGRVEYVNPFLLKLTGYEADAVIGVDFIERFIPERLQAEMRETFHELVDDDTHQHYRNPIITSSGAERMISWHNTVVRDSAGNPVGTLSVGEDITEHTVLEAQFRQAQKMEAVGRLAGGVAHDFNNILTAIIGYAELLQDALPVSDPRRDDVVEIRHAADRAASLTRQLLAFSRQQVLEPRVINVNVLLGGLDKLLQRLIGEDVELTTALATEPSFVRADPGQMEQVIINLAVNARDAMPRGGKLMIEVRKVELDESYSTTHDAVRPGHYVMLAVSDTGTGMTPDVKAHIFEPFFTTKEQGKGTGLGLATIYGIVKQSGGYVWVYSEPERGTTFKVYLPATSEESATVRTPVRTADTGGTETILLVEDDDALRNLASGLLSRRGYRVLMARSGDEALTMLGGEAAGSIDLLLTDLVLPGIGGQELQARAGEISPRTHVILMSGYTDRAVQAQEIFPEGTPFLQKPFAPAVLLSKVREVLDGPGPDR